MDDVGLTALIVALVALLVAVGQLAQQVFGTAEGYRRCQPSVLGPWAQRTRLVWRWSQFRFEVKFTSAHLVMKNKFASHRTFTTPQPIPDFAKIVDLDSTGAAGADVEIQTSSGTDTVSWIRLLKNLEAQQLACSRVIPRSNTIVSNPAMTLREWSWDLMPPEIVRPTSTTTIGTLVIIAHRLGMVWRDLRPSEGFLRAEGNGQSLMATIVRGFGLVVHYSVENRIFSKSLVDNASLRIPSDNADKMSFGIIPGCKNLVLLDVNWLVQGGAGGSADLSARASALRKLDIPTLAVDDMVDPGYWYSAMYDFMFMWIPFPSPYGSGMVEVFNPLRTRLDSSLLRLRELRMVLRARLNDYILCHENPSIQLVTLNGYMDELATRHRDFFQNSITFETRQKYPAAETVDFCHRVWDELTNWFVSRQEKDMLNYKSLVIDHLICNKRAWYEAEMNVRSGKHRDDGSIVTGPRGVSYVEAGHIYVDNTEAVKERMLMRGYTSESLMVDAAWTLLVRAIFCGASLTFLPEQTHPAVDSDFWDSQTPVYIT